MSETCLEVYEQGQVAGRVRFRMSHDRILYIRRLICRSTTALWNLRKMLVATHPRHVYFFRRKDRTWQHYRRPVCSY